MRGGIRPDFYSGSEMKSSKMTKSKLVDQVMVLQAYIDETESLARATDMAVNKEIASSEFDGLNWFGVAFIGWGTWEDDVFVVNASSPQQAIVEFEDMIERGHWSGHGENPDERHLWGQPDRIIVYTMVEEGEYQRGGWEKV